MRNEIINATKNSLSKLGIHTEVNLSARMTRHNNEYIRIDTNPFQTTPVIYKSVFVFGESYVVPCDEIENSFDLFINLDYGFKYFKGGSNGVEIGQLRFRIFSDPMRIWFIGFTI
jgi:hypothetical protein